MRAAVVVFNSHHECARPFDLQTRANPVHLLALVDELQVFEQVGGVGHAKRRMIVDADPKGIGVE